MTDVETGLRLVAASWDDIQAVFDRRGDPPRCQCQGFGKRAARN
jgi:hypothetical protein